MSTPLREEIADDSHEPSPGAADGNAPGNRRRRRFGIVERAFRDAGREPGHPPAIEDVVYAILSARGLGDIAENIRHELMSAEESETITA